MKILININNSKYSNNTIGLDMIWEMQNEDEQEISIKLELCLLILILS
jgi:hypothetical protein